MRIAVGMSGGADSSAAALALREAGHDVFGLTAWLWDCASPGNARACCGSPEALKAARDAAAALGLRHEVVDLSAEFEREVVGPTVQAYANGLTPNPCVLCNAGVRFPFLAKAARELGAEALATGHYAMLLPREGAPYHDGDAADRSGFGLYRGRDPRRDQSYFLFAVERAELAFARFPLGDMLKTEARRALAEAGHPAAARPASQDLCFTGGRSPAMLIRARAPDAARAGEIVDTGGKAVGRHRGLAHYTVGQRKGIGIAWTEPLYVRELRPATNELVGGPETELGRSRFEVLDLRWLREPADAGELEMLVQIRYGSKAVACRVRVAADGRAEVVLDEPARAVAPGQCAVFYDGQRKPCEAGPSEGDREVLGGGWIAP